MNDSYKEKQMDTFGMNKNIVDFCVDIYKSNPRQLVEVFRSPETTQMFVRETCIKS